MSKYSRLEVLNCIFESGLIPIYYHEKGSVAQQILDACMNGGAKTIEFTNRGDGAWQTFTTLLDHRRNNQIEVMLGSGTIIDVATAALYINLGADFLVGPTFNSDIAELCNCRKVAYIPGCSTPTEISKAEAAGVELVKIFPGNVLGSGFIRAVHGPMPWTNMVVTGGVSPDEESIREWFDAGVVAVGIGSKLIQSNWVTAGQYHKITELVTLTLGWIEQFKSQQHG